MNYIIIELLSETCLASGYGYGSIIDSDSTYDEYGLPIFPAKRFKGLLREAMKEYLLWGTNDFDEKLMEEWLGIAHNQRGTLILWNGELEQAEALKVALANDKSISRRDVIEHYSTVRRQTAIDDATGIARDGTLRSIRCFNKGLRFKMKIDGVTDINLFQNICKLINYAGLNRNRGLGLIKVVYMTNQSERESYASIRTRNDDNRSARNVGSVRLHWKSESPLLLTSSNATSSEGNISGSAFLGHFANAYLKKHQLKVADQTFYQLFFSGMVKFTNAYPSTSKMEKTIPCSVNYQKYKLENDDGYEMVDLVKMELLAGNAPSKSLSNHYMTLEETPRFVEPKLEVHFHHQQAAKAEDQQLFSYTAIAPNQYFVSEIEYDVTHEKEVLSWLENLEYITVGKSTNSQYGKLSLMKMQRGATSDFEERNYFETGDRVLIHLASDLVFIDPERGTYSNDGEALVRSIEERFGNLKIISRFFKYSTYSGFNGKWKMPKEQIPCFGKSSVLIGEVQGKAMFENQWFGEKNAEGYGKLYLQKMNERIPAEFRYRELDNLLVEDVDLSIIGPIKFTKELYRVSMNVNKAKIAIPESTSNHALYRLYNDLHEDTCIVKEVYELMKKNQVDGQNKWVNQFRTIQKQAFEKMENGMLPFASCDGDRLEIQPTKDEMTKLKRLCTVAIVEKMMEEKGNE